MGPDHRHLRCRRYSAGLARPAHPDGLTLAPIAHAGVHPILAIRQADGTVTGQIAVWADFMPAAGHLRPEGLFSHNPEHDLTASPVYRVAGAAPAVGADRYNDLACFLAARDGRTTRAYIDHEAFDPAAGMTAFVENGAAAWIQHTGGFVVAGEAENTGGLQARLRELTSRWLDAGRPVVEQWTTVFAPHPDLTAPLLTPSSWRHADTGGDDHDGQVVPAQVSCVLGDEDDIALFRMRQIVPVELPVRPMLPAAYAKWLWSLRAGDTCAGGVRK